MKEIWENITDYEGFYQISNLGRVKSLNRTVKAHKGNREIKERILKNAIHSPEYPFVNLNNNGKSTKYWVHRLVAEAFLDKPNGKVEVNHKDGNKLNCCVKNLEWITHSDNCKHAFNTGLRKPTWLGKFGRFHNRHKDYKGEG